MIVAEVVIGGSPLLYGIVAITFSLGLALLWYARVAPARVEETASTPERAAEAPPSNGRTLTWPLKLDETANDLGMATRFDLLERLGTIGAPWCADILVLAYRQEHEPELRDAALAALVYCGQKTSRAIFEEALRCARPSERALAVEGLAAIGAYGAASRGLDDDEKAVALAAAYALKRSGNAELVEQYFRTHEGDRRVEDVRKLLGALD